MMPRGCETDILRRLAEMPFLDRLELAAVSGRSRGAVYAAMDRLQQRGMVDAIPHAAEVIAPTTRYCLTADGLGRLAADEGVTIGQLLDTRPVSARWRRVLLERLDALAVIHRVAAALAPTVHPLRFRWYRAGPADAGIVLPSGHSLAVVRLGNTADRTAFAKRLWRLSEDARPDAALLLAPDEVRLRQVARMLDTLPLLGFLALEGEAARADGATRIWRTPSSPVPLDLGEVLGHLPSGGELPAGSPPRRESLPPNLDLDLADESVPGHLLPVLLKPAEKRALDLLHDWPWLEPAHLAQLLGVGRSRLYQILERLKGLGLAVAAEAGGRRCLALSDRGLALLARRDRAAVGTAKQRWSAAPVKPESPLTWRNVRGFRSRQLLRNLAHTQAVHWFLAVLANQSRQKDCQLAQFDPARRAARFFRRDDRLHSVRPDAFGVLKLGGKQTPFFLEWERRAVRPVTMAARIAPYLRYYATSRPLDEHGAVPAVLVVFDDELAATHFLRVADHGMRRAGVKAPLWVSLKAALERLGPLGAAWRRPGRWDPPRPFACRPAGLGPRRRRGRVVDSTRPLPVFAETWPPPAPFVPAVPPQPFPAAGSPASGSSRWSRPIPAARRYRATRLAESGLAPFRHRLIRRTSMRSRRARPRQENPAASRKLSSRWGKSSGNRGGSRR